MLQTFGTHLNAIRLSSNAEKFETTMKQGVDFGKTGSKKFDDVTSVRETKNDDNTSIISFKECSGFSIESCFC